MSTNYFVDFYVRENNQSNWIKVSSSCINQLKYLYMENVDNVDVSLDTAKEYVTKDFIGTYKGECLSKFNEMFTPIDKNKLDLVSFLYTGDVSDLDEYKVDMAFKDIEASKEIIINVYKFATHTHNGKFYCANSFYSFRDSKMEVLAKLEKQLQECHDLHVSLDYLKLTDEEKENVDSTYSESDLEDRIADIKLEIETAEYMIHLFNYFANDFWKELPDDKGFYDSECLAFIYTS